jgi:uncharacterized protein YdiU (UPF0061 family)
MYIGEIVNKSGVRWEMQFKGAGKTPFSRTADGRKVLRSSIREYLCSEAMFHLGNYYKIKFQTQINFENMSHII